MDNVDSLVDVIVFLTLTGVTGTTVAYATIYTGKGMIFKILETPWIGGNLSLEDRRSKGATHLIAGALAFLAGIGFWGMSIFHPDSALGVGASIILAAINLLCLGEDWRRIRQEI